MSDSPVDAPQPFAGEFPEASLAEWEQLVRAKAKNPDANSNDLQRRSEDDAAQAALLSEHQLRFAAIFPGRDAEPDAQTALVTALRGLIGGYLISRW